MEQESHTWREIVSQTQCYTLIYYFRREFGI